MSGPPSIVKVGDIKGLFLEGRADPDSVFPTIKKLAGNDQWQTREVAATAMVEIAKRHPAAVLREARRWAKDGDPNIRRASSEGLRGLVKQDPQSVRPVIEILRADSDLYVKKSVANVLRNASGRHPDFVRQLCAEWVRADHPDTNWIVKEGLRKLKP